MMFDIPSRPESLLKIRKLIKNDSGINTIVDVINKDISLAATVIKVANTPLFSRGHKVDSINRAASIIGVKRLETIAMHAALKNQSFFGENRRALDMVWRHSELVAMACCIIAEHCYKEARDTAYIAGLFHDCAIPCFIKRLDGYSDFYCRAMRASDNQIILEEKKAYGVDHCSVGGLICEKWDLPKEVVIGVEHHHCDCSDVNTYNDLIKSEHFYMVAILVVADKLVQNVDAGVAGTSGSLEELEEWVSKNRKAMDILNIDPYDIVDLKNDFLDKAFAQI